MDSRKREEIFGALLEEANEALRQLAVRLVLDKGMWFEAVTGMLDRGVDWAGRHVGGVLVALRDLPRLERLSLMPCLGVFTIICEERTGHVDPASLHGAIEKATGVRRHTTTVRGFLRTFGLSPHRHVSFHTARCAFRTTKSPGSRFARGFPRATS